MENPPTRVLIIDTAWIGDVIFSTALIGAIKRVWPNATIDVLVAPRGEAVLRGHEQVRELLVFDKAGAQSSWLAMGKLASALNERHFDLVLCAHPSPRSRLLCARLTAPVKVGYRGLGASLAFSHVISGDLAGEPDHVKRRLNLLRAVGIDISESLPLYVTVTEVDRAAADAILQSAKIKHPTLGLVIGSAWATKRWSTHSFALLAKRWQQETGGRSLLIAGKAEQQLAEQVMLESGNAAHPLIQQPLPTLRAVLQSCEAVVGNDTGLTYLAMAAGCAHVIALYGSTQVNYHYVPPHCAIHAGAPCCLSRYGHGKPRCKWNNGDAWCMEQITAERVWQQLRCRER